MPFIIKLLYIIYIIIYIIYNNYKTTLNHILNTQLLIC